MKQKSSKNVQIINPLQMEFKAQSRGSMVSHSDVESSMRLSFAENEFSDKDFDDLQLSGRLAYVEDQNSSSIMSSVLESSSQNPSSIFSDPLFNSNVHRKSIASVSLSSFSMKRLKNEIQHQMLVHKPPRQSIQEEEIEDSVMFSGSKVGSCAQSLASSS